MQTLITYSPTCLPTYAPRAAIRGFTLIEVLMAVFVLALALTGMMRMHLTALRAQQQNMYQAGAMLLAVEMAEMIHAYRAPGDDHPFLFDYRSGDPIPAANDCYGGALCDPSALRAFGIGQWLDTAHVILPAARIRICRDARPWSSGGDGDAWACNGGGGAGIVIKLGWRSGPGDGNPAEASKSSAMQRGPQLVLGAGEPAS